MNEETKLRGHVEATCKDRHKDRLVSTYYDL